MAGKDFREHFMNNSLVTIKPLFATGNLKGFLLLDAFVIQFFSKSTRGDDFAGQVLCIFCFFCEKGVIIKQGVNYKAKIQGDFSACFFLFHNVSQSHTEPK